MIELKLDVAGVEGSSVSGTDVQEMNRLFPQYDLIRRIERMSILKFVEANAHYLMDGRVLDYGAGTQPYKRFVRGEYVPHMRSDPSPVGPFDSIMCTQVIQYMLAPSELVAYLARLLKTNGYLLLTGPTNWEEQEATDYFRSTLSGVKVLAECADLDVIKCERRAVIKVLGHSFSLGYGLIAQKHSS